MRFELAHPDLQYLLIAIPDYGKPEDPFSDGVSEDDDYYVEVRGQKFGRSRGVKNIEVVSPQDIDVQLRYDPLSLGTLVPMHFSKPLAVEQLEFVRELSKVCHKESK